MNRFSVLIMCILTYKFNVFALDSDTIALQGSVSNPMYSFHDKSLGDISDMRDILQQSDEAGFYFDHACELGSYSKTLRTSGATLIALFCIQAVLGAQTHKSMWWGMGAVGVTAIGAAIPFSIYKNKELKSAVLIYNKECHDHNVYTDK